MTHTVTRLFYENEILPFQRDRSLYEADVLAF